MYPSYLSIILSVAVIAIQVPLTPNWSVKWSNIFHIYVSKVSVCAQAYTTHIHTYTHTHIHVHVLISFASKSCRCYLQKLYELSFWSCWSCKSFYIQYVEENRQIVLQVVVELLFCLFYIFWLNNLLSFILTLMACHMFKTRVNFLTVCQIFKRANVYVDLLTLLCMFVCLCILSYEFSEALLRSCPQ